MADPVAPTVPVPASELEARIAAVPALGPGTELGGRYRIVRFLARGGMGAVYEAFDRELGVTVALKTVRPDIPWGRVAIERFKREIALARVVTHPGVCRIFDLGKHGDLVFLTMELLSGVTLAERLAQGPIPERERFAIVVQLAGALEAAHAAGVVHRDLKPANLMLCPVASGTRVVITDFGVAREVASLAEVADEAGEIEGGVAATGVAGTPAYMAPEQLDGGTVGSAADVFALGVVMYELITRELPWSDTAKRQVVPGRLAAIDPRWAATIERCLSSDPAARFRTAGEIVASLRPRRRWPFAVAGVAVIAVAVGGVVMWGGARSDEEVCAPSELAASAWGPAQRASVARVVGDRASAKRVEAAVDRHVASWEELDRALCRDRSANRVSAAELTARARCLDRGLVGVRALGRQLAAATAPLDAATAAAAVRVAESLEPLDACGSRRASDDRTLAVPIDQELDDEMAEIELLIDLTQYASAVKRAQQLDERLAKSSDEYRRGRASFLLARGRIELGELVGSEAPLRESIRLAARVGDDVSLAQCWVALVRLLTQLGRMQEALTIANVAEAAVVRAGSDARLGFQLQMNLAWAEGWEDFYARSIGRASAAIAAAESVFGARDPDVIAARLTMAEHQVEVGDAEAGETTARRALVDAEAAFGTGDFRVAIARYVIGIARRERGDLATARVALERAVEDARALDEHHPGRFHASCELGRLYLLTGEHERAREVLDRALTTARGLHGPDGVRIGLALGYLGDARFALHDQIAAERLWTEALAVRSRARGEAHFSTGRAHSALGMIADARGNRSKAVEHLERAVTILDRSEVSGVSAIAQARLGRLLWQRPESRERARELAMVAKPKLRAPPGDIVFDLAELQRFVAEATR